MTLGGLSEIHTEAGKLVNLQHYQFLLGRNMLTSATTSEFLEVMSSQLYFKRHLKLSHLRLPPCSKRTGIELVKQHTSGGAGDTDQVHLEVRREPGGENTAPLQQAPPA